MSSCMLLLIKRLDSSFLLFLRVYVDEHGFSWWHWRVSLDSSFSLPIPLPIYALKKKVFLWFTKPNTSWPLTTSVTSALPSPMHSARKGLPPGPWLVSSQLFLCSLCHLPWSFHRTAFSSVEACLCHSVWRNCPVSLSNHLILIFYIALTVVIKLYIGNFYLRCSWVHKTRGRA